MARVRPVPMSRYINGFVTKIFAEELINQSLNNLNYSNETITYSNRNVY